MRRLSSKRETDIQNWLDEFTARLYHDVVLPRDAYTAHKVIKELLLDIYFLQDGMSDKEDKKEGMWNARGQPIIVDIGNKSI